MSNLFIAAINRRPTKKGSQCIVPLATFLVNCYSHLWLWKGCGGLSKRNSSTDRCL